MPRAYTTPNTIRRHFVPLVRIVDGELD